MKSGFHFHHHETWYQKRTRSHVNRVFLAPYGEFNHTKPCQKIVIQNTPWVNGKTCGNSSNLVSRYNDLKPIWNISTQNSNLSHSNHCSQKIHVSSPPSKEVKVWLSSLPAYSNCKPIFSTGDTQLLKVLNLIMATFFILSWNVSLITWRFKRLTFTFNILEEITAYISLIFYTFILFLNH